MSHDLRTIAKLDAFHTIGLCSHEALHLNWGSISLHIPLAQFVSVGQLLQRVEICAARQEALSNCSCRITQDAQGNFEVRFPDVAIYLGANDMLQFVLLVEEALLAINQRASIEELSLPTRPAVVQSAVWAGGRYRPSPN